MVSQTYHELLVDRYLYQFGETTESSPHTNIVGCMNPGFVTYKCRLNDNFYVNLPTLTHSTLDTKIWKKLEEMKKYRFFRQHLQAWVRLRSAKIGSKSPILIIFVSWKVFWDMPTCFQMFVDVFEPIKGVKNGLKQKTSIFSPNALLKTAISWFDFSRYKPLTFWWFQCIFLTYWVTTMGNPLGPVAPAHLGHLGHPREHAIYT